MSSHARRYHGDEVDELMLSVALSHGRTKYTRCYCKHFVASTRGDFHRLVEVLYAGKITADLRHDDWVDNMVVAARVNVHR